MPLSRTLARLYGASVEGGSQSGENQNTTLQRKTAAGSHSDPKKREPAGRLPAGSKPNSYQLDYLIGTKPTWAAMRWPAEPIVKSRNSLATPLASPFV